MKCYNKNEVVPCIQSCLLTTKKIIQNYHLNKCLQLGGSDLRSVLSIGVVS